jgi:hypothetical protein
MSSDNILERSFHLHFMLQSPHKFYSLVRLALHRRLRIYSPIYYDFFFASQVNAWNDGLPPRKRMLTRVVLRIDSLPVNMKS